MDIRITEEFKKALHLMENTKKNILITGRAGTGKSTLLDYFRNNTKKKVVILAPTGVAAVNVKGQTIHSFFGFGPDITVDKVEKIVKEFPNIYTEIDAIIIDEISMVRADLLDAIDKFLKINTSKRRPKKKPFGGKQMIFFGDLYQLPPVATRMEKDVINQLYESPYFFSANVMKETDLEIVELTEVFRQKDIEFIELLDAIRHGENSPEILEKLNERYIPDFEPPEGEFYIYLTSTNKKAREINERKLQELPGELFRIQGRVSGEFDSGSLPTDINLNIKIGAQVMLLNNDSLGRWINGTIGEVVDIDNYDESIYVELETGEIVEVKPFEWKLFRYVLNDEKVDTVEVGTFLQFPLKLAWAITIHKSQGKTFEKVIIDLSGGIFSPGQLYVALSRCTSFEGLVLLQPVKKGHVFMNWKAAKFLTKWDWSRAEKKLSLQEKVKIIESAISEDKEIEILYLKTSGKKGWRKIKPYYVGKMDYNGKEFIGVRAFCYKRNEDRTFRVDRILEIRND
ncbi:MAG: AAA family ATPase [Thermotogaceae bacterium]|nr:AAA family ATPase [Thermotogaceae bacterium]